MSYTQIQITESAEGVLTLCLNRPEKKNAMSAEMITELTDFSASLASRDLPKAVVLQGAGDIFCAGGDLAWMMQQIEADRATRIREATRLADMLNAMNQVPVPLIGAIHGAAFGGGLGLCAICDLAIATEDASFGFTETRLGIIPATIGPYVLARMGEGMARRVFMSGRKFDAKEAVALGLIARCVAPSELADATRAEVAPYLSVSTEAVGRAKGLARRLGPKIDEETIALSIEALADAWESHAAKEGISAFLERRPPNWSRPPADDAS